MEFLSLYDTCFDDVYRYVYFKTNNHWDTDDIVSEVFRKAYEKYRTVTDNPRAWLFTIARNTVIDYYRKKRGNVSLGDDLEQLVYPYSFEEEIEKKDETTCLKKALATLAKDDLELINLRYFSELKYQEIALTLGKTQEALKVKAHRITKKLRILVTKCLEG